MFSVIVKAKYKFARGEIVEIITAKYAGFCFGVKRALQLAQEAAMSKKDGAPIYSLGPLIHNPQVVDDLEKKGVSVVNDLLDINTGTLIIRSHGVSPEVFEDAEKKRLSIIDATCPFVKKAQQFAQQLLEEGYQVVVVGDKQHPEVIGIIGWANNEAIVVEKPEEAWEISAERPIGLIAQTTQPKENLDKVEEILKGRGIEVKVYNTICLATGERQESARELANNVDVMIIVGGKNSANTQKLARLCKATGTATYHIETAEELEGEWFENAEKIGITAGASTPDWIIEEVKNKCQKW